MSERTDDPASEQSERSEPVLRIVRGEPSAAELAAVVSVLLTARGGEQAAPRTPGWNDRRTQVRRPLRMGPGAWRASGSPRS